MWNCQTIAITYDVANLVIAKASLYMQRVHEGWSFTNVYMKTADRPPTTLSYKRKGEQCNILPYPPTQKQQHIKNKYKQQQIKNKQQQEQQQQHVDI